MVDDTFRVTELNLDTTGGFTLRNTIYTINAMKDRVDYKGLYETTGDGNFTLKIMRKEAVLSSGYDFSCDITAKLEANGIHL